MNFLSFVFEIKTSEIRFSEFGFWLWPKDVWVWIVFESRCNLIVNPFDYPVLNYKMLYTQSRISKQYAYAEYQKHPTTTYLHHLTWCEYNTYAHCTPSNIIIIAMLCVLYLLLYYFIRIFWSIEWLQWEPTTSFKSPFQFEWPPNSIGTGNLKSFKMWEIICKVLCIILGEYYSPLILKCKMH